MATSEFHWCEELETMMTISIETIAEMAIDHLEYSVEMKVEITCKKPAAIGMLMGIMT